MILQRRHTTRWLLIVAAVEVALVVPAAPSPAEATSHGKPYYLSLGDSLADSAQPNGDLAHGYSEQLHAALAATEPNLRLVKLGCGGESTVSMRFGSQDLAGAPVADVAGAFHNGEQPLSAELVCAWTWFCTHGDVHPNTVGYGVIAEEFLEIVS